MEFDSKITMVDLVSIAGWLDYSKTEKKLSSVTPGNWN